MFSILHQLLLGNVAYHKPHASVYSQQARRLNAVWNNTHHSDIGIERILRLMLLLSQYVLPGLHIRAFGHRIGLKANELLVEFFVLLKLAFPFYLLFYTHIKDGYMMLFIAYLLCDSLNYIVSVIFLDDVFPKTHSYRRTLILLFLNYLEVIISFAFFYRYAGLQDNSIHMSGIITAPLDHLYYSIMIATSIGFGDVIPASDLSKELSIIQAVLFLLFILFFFNFFNSRLENLKNKE